LKPFAQHSLSLRASSPQHLMLTELTDEINPGLSRSFTDHHDNLRESRITSAILTAT
jgi:hypothetical protein